MRSAALIIALFLAPAAAQAQDDEARWQRGVQLRAAGQDAEALAHFEAMHAESGSARTLAQVAFAEQALGRWGAAALHLEQARANPDAWVRSRSAVIEQARVEIARHVGQVEVLVDGQPVDVELDGVVVGRSPLPGPVPATAGTVSLRLLRGGTVVAQRTLHVQVGALTRESVRAPDGGSLARGSGDGGGDGGGVLVALGATSLAVGAAALVGMAVAWAIREERATYWNESDECTRPGGTRAQNCAGVDTDANTAGAIAIAMGIGGGAFAVLGAVLLGLGASASDARAALPCTPGFLGVRCEVSF